ncbi:MAG: T9SS type A sorting domain-containing protein, partial [Bacteroidales bacterium]|nr:T9SS type A sorting domain-containing protein [Bacteroidales bacterium]
VLCNGGSTGSIDITVTGGTPDYTYAWTTGAGTEDIGGLTAGCYTVTVTDANQCTITGTWCITEPPALTLTGMGSPVLCNGGSSGSIDIMVAGGTMPYGYAWSNGETSEDIGGLTAGCYTVTVMDANSCMITDTWCITEPSALSLTGISTPALCNGGSAGSIDITVAGGTMPYGYMWSNGESSEDISGLTAGTYTVTVTDANACMTSMSFMVSEPTALDLTAVVSNIDCNGNHNGAIDLTVTGGTPAYGYVWSNGESTEDLTGLFPGTYTVTVTDANACISINSWMVSEPSDISWYGSVTNVSCYGGSDGYIEGSTSGGTPPYTYLWSNGETTENIYNLTAGTYTVTPTDAHGCYTFTSRVVGQPDELLISQGTVISNVSCFGGSNGAIDITVTGGTMPYGYMWSNSATTEDISGLIAGIYNVTVTDAHGCQTFGEWNVEEAPALTLTGTPTPVLCNQGSTGSIDLTVTGGTMPYGYMWSNGESSEDIGGLSAGTYTVTVTDANGCQKSDNWTVTEPSALSITGTPTHVLCNGGSTGSIDITVTGGTPDYTYAWTTGAGTEDIGGLTAGCYTVTVTDANQCTITGTWCITEPPALTLTGMGSPVLCNGGSSGSIDIMVAGGTMPYGYTWSNGETSEDIGGLTAGCYTVTVMDANSCMITDTWCITEPDPLVITTAVVTHVTCNGASNGAINGGYDIIGQPLPIGVSGGTPPYSFIWSDGTTNNSLCCVPAGCYTVTVTDANNCMTTGTWCITEPSALTLTGTPSPVLCYGGSGGAIDITVTGGTPDYTYLWSNGVTDEDVSGLTAGTYTVTVTDANGCPITNSWTVTQPTELTVTGIAYPVLCNGGSSGMIDITVSGGTMPYAYFWSNGATSEDLSGLIAGTYTVIVYDDNECMATGSWTITEPSALSLEATVTSVTCYTGSTGAIDLTVMGGTPPYGYAWSNGAITEDISGLTAGTYTVTVTDANLCVATSSWMVSEPPMWSVGITGPTAACCNEPGVDDYYANVGGFLGYVPGTMIPCTPADITYEWVVVGGTITSGWNTSHITVDWECCTIGTVTVTATKCDGCFLSTTLNVAVSLPPAPVITGPATVYSNGTDTYCALPEIPGHLYSWTVINGSYTTIPGTNCITVTWNSYPACGCAMVIVCETDPITGCTGCDTLYVTMLPDPLGISLSGTVSYKNGLPNTPLNGVTIKLRDLTSGLIIATTVSGPNMNPPLYTGDPGYYAFTNVPSGNYRLESSFNGTWGGNNATDALLIQLEAGSIPGTYLSGLFRIVADVNASLTVTALDALYVKLRTVGSINSYPAGDWKFEQPTISTLPAVVDFAGLCVGDVNGSYIPTGLKAVSFLSVVDDETQTIPVEETFTYEIRSNMVAQLGAMTLFMGYNNDLFEVIDVTASSNNDEMKYVIEDGNVAIAWADTRPMSVRNSDQIFTLTVKAKAPVAEATQIFDVRTGSEFASPTGIRYDNFDLKMSKVITMGGSKEFAMFNYPNPFANSTKIVYTLPESGNVTLVITDMFGKTVRTLVDDFQVAGTYSIPVVAADLNLSSGVYLYRIEATGVTDTYVKVNKMIFAR